MKLVSWNVNGIRASYKKGLMEFIEREKPEILCLQETKAQRDQVTKVQAEPLGMKSYWSSATTKKGYSGTATFLKEDCESVSFGIGIEKYDAEGRFVITEHKEFTLFNIYFPNGSSKVERHDFKQEFLKDLSKHLKKLIAKGRQIVVVGDYNIAHLEIDVHDPVRLSKISGFLPEEREWFDTFLELGFVDTFRHFYPEDEDVYSWWDMRSRARMSNKGWRIDYICVTEPLMKHVKMADVWDEQEGSDHCPVIVEFEF